jgi:membrane-associated phospholipid phosphatase
MRRQVAGGARLMVVDLSSSGQGYRVTTRRSLVVPLVLWALSSVVLVGVSVLFLDRAVATWSHDDLHHPAIAVLVTKAARLELICGAALAVAVAGLIARLTGRPLGRAWRAAMAASLATLLAALAVIFLKYGFGRLWPETWLHNPPNPSWIGQHQYAFQPFHGGEGNGSFPSGHTARVTAPCAVLWQRLPKLRPLWVLPPVLIAAGLIGADFHFLGDCIAGAYVGIASAALMLLIF